MIFSCKVVIYLGVAQSIHFDKEETELIRVSMRESSVVSHFYIIFKRITPLLGLKLKTGRWHVLQKKMKIKFVAGRWVPKENMKTSEN